jgi:hypothetical protein
MFRQPIIHYILTVFLTLIDSEFISGCVLKLIDNELISMKTIYMTVFYYLLTARFIYGHNK